MTDTSAPRPFTGWHMWGVIVLFFGTIIGVNVYLSVEAYRTWTGVVVDRAHQDGLDYTEKVDRAAKQKAAGWTSSVTYSAGALHFELRDAAGKPVPAQSVDVSVTQPIGDRNDQDVTLAAGTDGTYGAAITIPAGIWNVIVTAVDTSLGDYELREQIVVP